MIERPTPVFLVYVAQIVRLFFLDNYMLKAAPKISVITICCNRLEYTARTISSVIGAMGDVDYEYLVVDSGSEDGTREWLSYIARLPYFRKIRPIIRQKNTGMMDAFSQGVVESSSPMLIFTDNDILVHSKDVGKKIIQGGRPYGMSDFIVRQRNRHTEYVDYPVAFFYMMRQHYVFGMNIPDDYSKHKMKFFVHKDIICEHIDGADSNQRASLSKKKYPMSIIYRNKEKV